MKRITTLLTLVVALVSISCQKDKATESSSELLTPSHSIIGIEAKPSSITADDASIVATLYSRKRVKTKGTAEREVRDVVTVSGSSGNPVFYAVNYIKALSGSRPRKTRIRYLPMLNMGIFQGMIPEWALM